MITSALAGLATVAAAVAAFYATYRILILAAWYIGKAALLVWKVFKK